MKLSMLMVVAVLAGCGKGSAPGTGSAAVAASGSGSGSSSATGSGSAAPVGSATTPAATTPAGSAAAGSAAAVAATPLSPKIDAAKCGEPCLFLLDTPITQLTDAYKTKCGGMETKNLGFDDCKQLDYARNCVYAAHGLVYKKKKWAKLFSAKPWYEPHAEVDAKKLGLSDVEHANVHELYERGKACKKNLKISGADYERVKAWFASLPKPQLPKQTFHWNGNGDTDPADFPKTPDSAGFVQWLTDAEPTVKAKFAAGKEVDAAYEDAEQLALQKTLLDAIHAPDPSKLRSITVDVEIAHGTDDEPFSDGVTLRFVYDDKDQLVALTGDHYSFD